MAIWPFNRNRQADGQKKVPKEVEQYYQSERRDRVGVAWLLAGLTLIITVLIVLGLFLGGRWAYRRITDKDDSTNQTAQTDKPAEQESPASAPESSDGATSSENNDTPSSSGQGTVNAPTQSNNPSSVSTQPTQTSGNLANTGPGQTVAIFAVVSLAGYLGYSTYLRRKFN